MREKRILLEHGVHLSLVGRHVVDPLSTKEHVTAIRRLKSADNAKRGGFSAARGAQKRDKFLVMDLQIHIVQNGLSVKRLGNSAQPDQNIFVHSA